MSPTLLADRPPGVAVPVGFAQKSYDQYETDTVAPTLKAKGGSYGGGTELLIPYTLKIRGGCPGGVKGL